MNLCVTSGGLKGKLLTVSCINKVQDVSIKTVLFFKFNNQTRRFLVPEFGSSDSS